MHSVVTGIVNFMLVSPKSISVRFILGTSFGVKMHAPPVIIWVLMVGTDIVLYYVHRHVHK